MVPELPGDDNTRVPPMETRGVGNPRFLPLVTSGGKRSQSLHVKTMAAVCGRRGYTRIVFFRHKLLTIGRLIYIMFIEVVMNGVVASLVLWQKGTGTHVTEGFRGN